MREALKFFGEGLPYLKTSGLKGKLIAIEGTDGVGRSTQIDLLEEWLQVQGYAVMVSSWTRSNLMSRSIEMAKSGNMLNRMTFSLLYATDFADRLENQIIPALRSGYIVLMDRYVYTAFARDAVRDPNQQWIKDVFGFAPIPDLVCYLRIDVENLIPRVIESGGMNYWESGMDLHLADNIFDSFKKYQKILIDSYDNMVEPHQFKVADARQSVMDVQNDLRKHIESILKDTQKTVVSLPPMPGRENKSENSTLGIAKDIHKKLQAVANQFSQRIDEARAVAEVQAAQPLAGLTLREESDDTGLPFSGVLNSPSQNPTSSEPTDSN